MSDNIISDNVIVEAFQRIHGTIADWNDDRSAYDQALGAFYLGWQARADAEETGQLSALEKKLIKRLNDELTGEKSRTALFEDCLERASKMYQEAHPDDVGWASGDKTFSWLFERVRKLEIFEAKAAVALDDAERFHPRAMKLIRNKVYFIVVARDEPYFMEVYETIRNDRIKTGRWSDEDEQIYQEWIIRILGSGK